MVPRLDGTNEMNDLCIATKSISKITQIYTSSEHNMLCHYRYIKREKAKFRGQIQIFCTYGGPVHYIGTKTPHKSLPSLSYILEVMAYVYLVGIKHKNNRGSTSGKLERSRKRHLEPCCI